ncbi:MAG: hypothetical protein JNK02_03905 [Planctomycetes bacterium]|nr:hypothetical protein [Planctomycetota bacterium]
MLAMIALRAAIGALFSIGLVSRAIPLFADETRLLRQFPTEDGYLMLTIARNFALGHGFSTAAGTLPTNGTQPLMSAVYAGCFALFDGERVAGVRAVLAIQLVLALVGAVLLFLLSRRVLANHPRGNLVAALATAVWFASGIGVKHGMNCLETGAFAACVLWFVHAFLAPPDPLSPWSPRRALFLGAVLGLTLWARVDAVFLVLAACLVRFLLGPGARLAPTRAQFGAACVMGATAVTIIAPWLVHNYLGFGSIVPVSGRAEAGFGSFASNLAHLPVAIAEYVVAVIPVPASVETHPAVIAGSVVVIVAAGALAVRIAHRADARVRTFVVLLLLYAGGLALYYGFFFGVPFFLSRYMFPLAAFAAILWAAVVDALLARRPSRWPAVAVAGVTLALLLVANWRIYRDGRRHMHFQVVEWVQAHVPREAWVGAVQTGTLGFFHDRAINLDGKVNPAAHAAVREHRIPEYVVSQPIEYLADWAGLAEWAHIPLIATHFELVVADPEADLAVFRRRPR